MQEKHTSSAEYDHPRRIPHWLAPIIIDQMREVPHVGCKEEGLRCVDVKNNFTSHQELDEFIENCTLIGVGKNAVVFTLNSEPDSLFRLEIINPAGYEWIIHFLNELHQKSHEHFQLKIDYLIRKVEDLGCEPYQRRQKDARKKFRIRIAAHNSQFRRDPSSTVPVNSYYTFNDEPLALSLKYLKGKSLAEIDENAQVCQEHLLVLKDRNPANVIMMIENSSFPIQLIDLCIFIPSNRDLYDETRQDSD